MCCWNPLEPSGKVFKQFQIEKNPKEQNYNRKLDNKKNKVSTYTTCGKIGNMKDSTKSVRILSKKKYEKFTAVVSKLDENVFW